MSRPPKKLTLVAVTLVLVLAIALSSFLYLGSVPVGGGELESIDVAYSPFESLGLFWVAQDQGFFTSNGLNLTVHRYESGAAALSGVVNGEADIAVGTTEFPLVIRALNNESLQTIGTISESNFVYLVGRADRGIKSLSDLEGKTIGTTFGTIAHYFLGRSMALNGLDIEDVALVNLKTPSEWVNAVVDGSVDAVTTAQPYVNSAMEGLGDNAVAISLNSGQPLFAQVIATNEWISKNPTLCSRFLESLYMAEKYTINQPAEVREIVKKQMNFTDAYMETVWSQNHYSLTLAPSLILAMESEARWLISNNLTIQTEIPDFMYHLYFDGLSAVNPDSVTITR